MEGLSTEERKEFQWFCEGKRTDYIGYRQMGLRLLAQVDTLEARLQQHSRARMDAEAVASGAREAMLEERSQRQQAKRERDALHQQLADDRAGAAVREIAEAMRTTEVIDFDMVRDWSRRLSALVGGGQG